MKYALPSPQVEGDDPHRPTPAELDAQPDEVLDALQDVLVADVGVGDLGDIGGVFLGRRPTHPGVDLQNLERVFQHGLLLCVAVRLGVVGLGQIPVAVEDGELPVVEVVDRHVRVEAVEDA